VREVAELLTVTAIVPVLLTSLGLIISLLTTISKFRTRQDLSKAIQSSPEDLIDLNNKLEELKNNPNDQQKLAAAADLLRKHFENLSDPEKRQAEEALGQPSPTGRANYIRGVATDASEQPRS
jgi:hypothetical protein